MKKVIFVFVVLVGIFFSNSCSNDFDLVADWKDIPVVYGLLSRSDTAHYVRVEKAFLDPETSALQLAQIADSIYYPNATVKLVRSSDDKEYVFTKVDGNMDGYPREEGTFADTPNWLYKLKLLGDDTLRANANYQLIINRDETSEPVTSTIRTVSDLEIQRPSFNTAIKLYNVSGNPINLTYRWSFDNENTFIFDAYIRFFYEETINGAQVPKSFEWQVVSQLSGEDGIRIEEKIPGEDFYKIVAANIEGNDEIPRKFRYLEFEVVGAGQSFLDYININKINLGITSAQLIPNFTNMSEGYGLFASRHSVMQTHLLDFIALDSLKNGHITDHLNFQ